MAACDAGACRSRRPPARRSARASPRLDGVAKVTGRDRFGADAVPADALWIRVVRSPHARARFAFGDLGAAARAGSSAVLTAADVPFNGFGIYPDIKDQPVLADGLVRYRGEAVLALVGERADGAGDPRRRDCRSPGRPSRRCSASTPRLRPMRRWSRPTSPATCCSTAAWSAATRPTPSPAAPPWPRARSRPPSSSTPISSPRPAGRGGSATRIEIHASTQAPYMDRDEIASVHAASRPRRCASCRPPAAAASAASSTSRCSR